jgi:magnesium chelatase family protein
LPRYAGKTILSRSGPAVRKNSGCYRRSWRLALQRRHHPALLGKFSGPPLDRVRVERARGVQQSRGYYNSQIPVRQLRKICALDDAGERTLEMAVRRMGLSARAHDRVLKVARTIADLDASDRVTAKHLAEATQYGSLELNYWQ